MPNKFNETVERWRERWDNLYESQRRRALFAVGALVMLAVGLIGYRLLREPFRQWRGQQALSQAEHYLHQQDYRSALLALKRATMLTPQDPATWRTVARHLDELGMPESLVAHENIVQLDPTDTQQRLALAKQALRFDNADLAAKTLATIPSGIAAEEEYHRLAAALALSTGRDRDYTRHLQALLEINPADPGARFNLAVMDLWSGDSAREYRARKSFTDLLQGPEMRIRAALELLKDAARRHDATAATQTAREIDEAFPTPAVLAGQPLGWERLRAKLKAAATSPADVALLARWFSLIGLRDEALAWIDQLPTETKADAGVGDAAITLSAHGSDPARFERWLSSGAWGVLPERVIKLAGRVLAARTGGISATERSAWLEAFAAANDSAASLRVLARLAAIWNNEDETEQALRGLIRLSPNETWAYQSLQTLYTDQGRTEKLWELYRIRRQTEPDNPNLAAQWWLLAALLDRLPPNAKLEVDKLHASAPQNPAVAAAIAAVWWRKGEYDAALERLNDLPEGDRIRPEMAYWLGVIGAQTGAPAARSNLLIASEHSTWLPEQKELLSMARAKIGAN